MPEIAQYLEKEDQEDQNSNYSDSHFSNIMWHHVMGLL